APPAPAGAPRSRPCRRGDRDPSREEVTGRSRDRKGSRREGTWGDGRVARRFPGRRGPRPAAAPRGGTDRRRRPGRASQPEPRPSQEDLRDPAWPERIVMDAQGEEGEDGKPGDANGGPW